MKLRNPYGEDRVVPALGRIVEADEVIELDDKDKAQIASFQESGWEPVSDKKKES